MTADDVQAIVSSKPFVPLRLYTTDGKKIDIAFQHAVRLLDYGVVVFKGVANDHSYVAKGYDVVSFGRIERIEPRKARGSGRRRKAS
jgi:hypothetical protein